MPVGRRRQGHRGVGRGSVPVRVLRIAGKQVRASLRDPMFDRLLIFSSNAVGENSKLLQIADAVLEALLECRAC